MMDILKFINSNATRNHLKEIKYEFTSHRMLKRFMKVE